MKAAFALLADAPTHNKVRGLTWHMYQKYGISLGACRLPPHISLKQPFDILDVRDLEGYMTELVASLPPVDITLTEMQLIEMAGSEGPSGILWLQADKSPILRQLHARLNKELALRFGDTHADFDGPEYQFHLTLTLGKLPLARYQAIYQEFQDVLGVFRFQARSLALFAYDNSIGSETEYISYKILPLGS